MSEAHSFVGCTLEAGYCSCWWACNQGGAQHCCLFLLCCGTSAVLHEQPAFIGGDAAAQPQQHRQEMHTEACAPWRCCLLASTATVCDWGLASPTVSFHSTDPKKRLLLLLTCLGCIRERDLVCVLVCCQHGGGIRPRCVCCGPSIVAWGFTPTLVIPEFAHHHQGGVYN